MGQKTNGCWVRVSPLVPSPENVLHTSFFLNFLLTCWCEYRIVVSGYGVKQYTVLALKANHMISLELELPVLSIYTCI